MRYVSIPHGDLVGGGIDQLSAEDSIPEGYAEDLLNCDPTPQGYAEKRPGYQGTYGNLPVRVFSIEYSTTLTDNLTFILDQSIDLTQLESIQGSRPIVVWGRTSTDNVNDEGDFPTEVDTVHYYSEFRASARRTFATGTHTTTILQPENQLVSPNAFIGVTQSLSPTTLSNELIIPDVLSINTVTEEIDVTYTNGTGSDFEGFIYFTQKDDDPGETFNTSHIFPTGISTFTILAATHGIATSNLLIRTYINAAGLFTEFKASQIVVTAVGDVLITVDNETASSFSTHIILVGAEGTNVAATTVPSGATGTLTFSITRPFLFTNIYRIGLSGSKLLVDADSIVVDTATELATVTITNGEASGVQFEAYWEEATVSVNQLTVDASVISTTFTDDTPQLTIWGLDHALLYSSSAEGRAGWTTHIDSYKAPGERFLVSGLGGNIFKGQVATEAAATEFLMPTLYPNLRILQLDDSTCGPCFISDTAPSYRTMGHIRGFNLAEGWGRASSMVYNTTTGFMDVTIPVVNFSIEGPSAVRSVDSHGQDLADRLTIQSAGYSQLNGDWVIQDFDTDTASLFFSIAVDGVDSSDFDDSDSGALVGIFSDTITNADFTVIPPFIRGDFVTNDFIADEARPLVYSAYNFGLTQTTILLSQVTQQTEFPSGSYIQGIRPFSSVIPLRSNALEETVEDLVGGDMCSLTNEAIEVENYARQFRIQNINVNDTTDVTLSGDGTTLTVSGIDTTTLAVGDRLLLINAFVISGGLISYVSRELTIEGIESITEFTVASDILGTGTGAIQGATVAIDDTIEISDNIDNLNPFSVVGRWTPFEVPNTTQFDYTRIRPLDVSAYDDQPTLRSTQASDSLYMNNGVDRPLKLDGSSVYRPGLTRWQAQLFTAVNTGATGKIVLNSATVATTGWATNRFAVTAGNEVTFTVGQQIQINPVPVGDTQNQTYTVTDTSISGVIVVDRNILGTTAASTLSSLTRFSYYFRLNAVDINGFIVASAVTGSADSTVVLGADAAVRLRLVGLPPLDMYDWDRIEVQIYRTKANGIAPYYRLTTLSVPFGEHQGYINYTDTASDLELFDLDEVNTALKGSELGTGWSQPIRSKFITSAGGRTILSNLTSDPYLDMRFVDKGTPITQTLLNTEQFSLDFRRNGTSTTPNVDRMNVFVGNGTGGALTTTTITNIVPVAGISFTVTTSAPHTLSIGSWVYMYRSTANTNLSTSFMGWWQVISIPTTTTFRVNWDDTPAAITFANEVNAVAYVTGNTSAIPVLLGPDFNYQQLRADTTVVASPYESITMHRIANAINSCQRMTNVSIAGQANYRPWIVADSGGEFQAGQLIVRQPVSEPTSFSCIVYPSSTRVYSFFVNEERVTNGTTVTAAEALYPSRLIGSYANFAEIFDSPLVAVDSQSDSAVDINPDDGQQITAALPFFADSAFGAALKDAVVVAFKERSIYLVNFSEKAAGRNPIQRIESQGLGCTVPSSVTPVRDGILFANESGIYKLKFDLTVSYVGKRLQRIWREQVDRSQEALPLMFGHNWATGNKYRLSIPMKDGTHEVLSYDSTREYVDNQPTGRDGSWTAYSLTRTGEAPEQPIGWANLDADSFYASTVGRVMQLRQTGLRQDYRDDDQAIGMSATLRAMDFGDDGIRKSVPWALVSYRNPLALGDRSGTDVLSSVDLSTEFDLADVATLPNRAETTGTGDEEGNKGLVIRYSFGAKRGVYFQLQLTDNTKDEPVSITKVRYQVAGLTVKGTTSAASTAPAKGARS